MPGDIPLIDITRWRTGGQHERIALATRLDHALSESGFLLVAGHGIPQHYRTDIRGAVRRFFQLTPEEKAPYTTHVGGRGWVPSGREANSFYGEATDTARADLKESYTIGRDFRTGDRDIDQSWFAPNVWPVQTPELAGLAQRYANAVSELYDDLLELCAVALGVEQDWFTSRTRLAPHTFNINRYPALSDTGPVLDGQFRIAPHTDWGVITILDRQPGYGGLQVQSAAGQWQDAPFEPDAFTVNIGDLMARWTGDRWRSTRHRVLPPSPEAPKEELISLIMFMEADVDTVIESFAPPIGRVHHYDPVTAGEYLQQRASAATVPA